MAFTRKSKADRRAEIVAVAAQLMLRKGLKNTTTRDITTELGVGSGLLNHYFRAGDLKREAFEQVAKQDIEHTFGTGKVGAARRVIDRLQREAFSKHAEPYWRLWLEAMEEAASDPLLAAIIHEHTLAMRANLEAALAQGNSAGDWRCADPKGAAIRILAMHDGLLSLVLTGTTVLTRVQAKRHFKVAIAHELGDSRHF